MEQHNCGSHTSHYPIPQWGYAWAKKPIVSIVWPQIHTLSVYMFVGLKYGILCSEAEFFIPEADPVNELALAVQYPGVVRS